MIELSPLRFLHVRSLLANLKGHHLSIASCLEEATSGHIWVNQTHHPNTALLQINQRLYLVGEPSQSQAVKTQLSKCLLQAKAAREWGFLLTYETAWADILPEILPEGVKATTYQRMYLEHTLQEPPHLQTSLPDGFELKPVNRELIEHKGVDNLEVLLEELCSERSSVEDFLAKSFGVCLLYGNLVVGWCLSEYNWGERCEVGIATAEPFRKRGLATLQGQAFLEQAFGAGIRKVGWHCWANNLGSVNTALRLGFAPIKKYQCMVLEV